VKAINLKEKFANVPGPYIPRIVGELNGQYVKLVRFKGPFVMHSHPNEDEMFLVVEGSFRMEYRDRSVDVRKGEFVIVPRGVEHRPVADAECQVLLFEPKATLNTGDVRDSLTQETLEWV
jgi:mannose-6-phosphate isomerase-like protein (cupin superfamily)